jgi:predicted metal-binding membrane protein
MIGLVFMLTRMMINFAVGVVTITWWMFLAIFLLVPGAQAGTRRSMRGASRSVSRAFRRMLPII